MNKTNRIADGSKTIGECECPAYSDYSGCPVHGEAIRWLNVHTPSERTMEELKEIFTVHSEYEDLPEQKKINVLELLRKWTEYELYILKGD